MSVRGRIPKLFAAALLTGGLTAGAILLATQLRAQTPVPAPAAPVPSGARGNARGDSGDSAGPDPGNASAVLCRMGELAACQT